MDKLTTEQENAVYNAICEASNATAKRGTYMGTGEIYQVMRNYGLVEGR